MEFKKFEPRVLSQWILNCLLDRGDIQSKDCLGEIVFSELMEPGSTSRCFKIQLDNDSTENKGVHAPCKKYFLKVTDPYFFEDAKRECKFYRFTKQVNKRELPIPKIISSFIMEEDEIVCLLFEFYDEGYYQTPLPLEPSRIELLSMIQTLAKLHGNWWNDSIFGEAPFLKPNSEFVEEWVAWIGHLLPSYLSVVSNRLPQNYQTLYEQVLHKLPQLLMDRYRTGDQRWTLLHDDVHVGNFMFTEQGGEMSSILLDWQGHCVGLGASDLAHFFGLHCRISTRMRYETEAIQCYLESLKQNNIEYQEKEFWADYRVSLIAKVFFPVIFHHLGYSPYLWWPIVDNIIEALEYHDCLEMV